MTSGQPPGEQPSPADDLPNEPSLLSAAPPRSRARLVLLRTSLVCLVLVAVTGLVALAMTAGKPSGSNGPLVLDRAADVDPGAAPPDGAQRRAAELRPQPAPPAGAGSGSEPSGSPARPRPDKPQPKQPQPKQPQATDDPSTSAEQPAPRARPRPSGDWVGRTSEATGVPAAAVRAYASAELTMRQQEPACKLTWVTLAALGRIESDHGRYGDRSLGADGVPSSPIIGVALDGGDGVRKIADTDDGYYDGDTAVDRAVGPMQFIPATWRRWRADGNLDGVADPQNINDAALAAARYVCAGSRDLSRGDGWWQAVLSYNDSVDYGRRVYGVAKQYVSLAERA